MKLPKSWSDISIKKYRDIVSLNTSDLKGLDYKIHLLTTLSGEHLSVVEKIYTKDFVKALNSVLFITKMPEKLQPVFKCNGKTYKAELYIHRLSAGQYIDLMTLCKDSDTINENLHKIMAVYCVEQKRKWYGKKYTLPYDGAKAPKLAQEFEEHLTMDIVYPMSAFFLKTLEHLTPAINAYLKAEAERLVKMTNKLKKKKDLQSVGVG